MKKWSQLIALNLVLVLLLSLFPVAAFAAEGAAEPAQELTQQEEAAQDTALEEPQETDPTVMKSPATANSGPVTLRSGESFSYLANGNVRDFPQIVIQTENAGYYRLRVTPPETMERVTINGSWGGYDDGSDMYFDINYTMIAPFPVVDNGAGYDFVYYLWENNTPSFTLHRRNSEVQTAGLWTFSVDYIEPEPLEFDVPLGASDSETFHVYTTELERAGCYTVSTVSEAEFASFRCANGPSNWDTWYAGSDALQGESDYFYAYEGMLVLIASVTTGGSGIVIRRCNPEGDFGAEDGTNLHWYLDGDQKKLTISGTGSMGDAVPWRNLTGSFSEVEIEPGVTDIAPDAFGNCGELKKAVLPEGLISIGDRAFCYCHKLADLNLPSTVQSIGEEAFRYTAVPRFAVPAGLTSIGAYALCSERLTCLTVDADNPAYSSADGVLYTKDGSTLLRFPARKQGPFFVPDAVTAIGATAFENCWLLNSLYLPAGLQSLGSSSFSPQLVCFGGTAEQWQTLNADGIEVAEKNLRFECSRSDYLGQAWKYEVESAECYPAQSFTPEETGVYMIDQVAPSGISCFQGYTSPESMTVYVSRDGEQMDMVDDWGVRPMFYLRGGQSYELQAQPGCGEYSDGYYPVTEVGTYEMAAQRCAVQTLTLGENVIPHLYYGKDYYVFAAPADGYYVLSYETSDPEYRISVSGFTEGLRSGIDDHSCGYLLKAGQVFVLPLSDYLEWIKLTVEAGESSLQGACGENVTWSLDGDGVLTISGSGDMADYPPYWSEQGETRPWFQFAQMVKKVVVEEGVTSIGDFAFSRLNKVCSVTLPSTLRSIGENAFCYDYNLLEIALPDGLQEIGRYAFEGCEFLREMMVPDSVRSIGDFAFEFCSTMERLRLPAQLERLGEGVLAVSPNCEVELPENAAHFVMRDGILYDKDLTTVYYTDHDRTGAVRLPESVTKIGAYAFAYSGIESLKIPEGVASIPIYMCRACRSLTEIRFPSSITERFFPTAVYDCLALRDVYFDGSAVEWYRLCGDLSGSAGSNVTYHFSKASEAEPVEAGTHPLTLTEASPSAAYCFTAPTAGLYRVFVPDILSNLVLESGDAPWSITPTPIVEPENYVKLDAGEKLFIVMRLPDIETEEISWTVEPANPEQAEADVCYELQETDRTKLYRFVPQADGEYRFHASGFARPIPLTIYSEDLAVLYRVGGGASSASVDLTLEAGKPIYVYFYSGSPLQEITWSLEEVNPSLKITGQPEDQYVERNTIAVFFVQAEGEGLSYQWYYRQPGKTFWYASGSEGAQTDTLYVEATAKRDGQSYRCEVRNAEGRCKVSEEATLTVYEPSPSLWITMQPEDASAAAGDTVCFSVSAEGEDLTYQWQYCQPGKDAWSNSSMEGAQSDTLTVPVAAKRDGQRYRCVITDAYGEQVISEPATLTVETAQTPLEILSQPQDASAAVGETVSFRVTAQGDDLTYQWQFCQPGKDTWSNSSMDGANTDTLVVLATAKRDGQRYRCVITDANGEQVISDPATLTVASTVIEILSQPQDASAAVGETVFFIVSAQGDGLTYQWQYCQPGKDAWSKSSMDGANTDTLAVPVTAKRDGQRYRCVITDASGKRVISDPAMLTIAAPGDPITILSQPQDVSAAVGETVSFSVSAEGDGLTYQWQYRQAGKTTWSKSGMSGAATDTLVVPVTAKRNGQSYRCVITDAAGNQLITKSATLHIG